MPPLSLEKRVESLENQVAELQALLGNGQNVKQWWRTVGMFTGDEVMMRIDEEARKYREADRQKARRRIAKKQNAKS